MVQHQRKTVVLKRAVAGRRAILRFRRRRRVIGRAGVIINRGRLGRSADRTPWSKLFESSWRRAVTSADKLAALTIPEAISGSLDAAFFTPRDAMVSMYGRVALVRAKVDVLGTDAGMFGTA